jgi:predicted nucleic acid binding AN1-type Zn finger protein
METGEHCALETCGRLSFLPVPCPLCIITFCESHFLPDQHACAKAQSTVLSDDELLRRIATSGSSGRLPCQKQGCKKLSFEVQAPPSQNRTVASDPGLPSSSQRTFTHAAPRCDRCKGLFCAMHRSAISHGCTGPAPLTEGQRKLQAIEDRKKKAAALIAKNFPNRGKT